MHKVIEEIARRRWRTAWALRWPKLTEQTEKVRERGERHVLRWGRSGHGGHRRAAAVEERERKERERKEGNGGGGGLARS